VLVHPPVPSAPLPVLSVPQYTVPLVYAFRSQEPAVAEAIVKYVVLVVPLTWSCELGLLVWMPTLPLFFTTSPGIHVLPLSRLPATPNMVPRSPVVSPNCRTCLLVPEKEFMVMRRASWLNPSAYGSCVTVPGWNRNCRLPGSSMSKKSSGVVVPIPMYPLPDVLMYRMLAPVVLLTFTCSVVVVYVVVLVHPPVPSAPVAAQCWWCLGFGC
jgi:hypothetical protein